jgi:hypothetical protein
VAPVSLTDFSKRLPAIFDSGFGLLGSEVAFLATTLAAIDVTLAALFWAWGTDEDIIARLVKKTMFVGVFAYPDRQLEQSRPHRFSRALPVSASRLWHGIVLG